MSRGIIRSARPYVVWLGVTGAAAAAAHAVPGTWRAAAGASAPEAVPHVLVAACATGLALSLAWLWLVTSVTVAEVRDRLGAAPRRSRASTGAARVRRGRGRRYGAAGTGIGRRRSRGARRAPAARARRRTGHGRAVRAHPPPRRAADRYVVRSGDSLWSIARAHPAPDTDVETRWRAIWRHNRDVVGDDPDLIHPGQALRLPDTDPSTEPNNEKDGERR